MTLFADGSMMATRPKIIWDVISPKCPTTLFVGGPLNGQMRKVHSERQVVNGWEESPSMTEADKEHARATQPPLFRYVRRPLLNCFLNHTDVFIMGDMPPPVARQLLSDTMYAIFFCCDEDGLWRDK